MKYRIAIDLDSCFLQVIDGARVVGTLHKKGASFDLHPEQLHEDEVADVAAAIDAISLARQSATRRSPRSSRSPAPSARACIWDAAWMFDPIG